ncbi:MAG: hypothetical protein COA82_13460 [Alkaliphilus sp.]|nr:hypothetical protein [bacterium AH-315-G05]PHS28554.1 MAG: hypothetical protein COA82_13460 [Alkaliphilus sp.]
MKITIIGGAASTGKTAITLYALRHIITKGIKPAVVKIDCLDASQDKVYASLNIPFAVGLSKDLCPDHYLATNYIGMFNWAKSKEADLLIIETAGLCNRCAPFIDLAFSICSIDYTTSINAPAKFGPIVKTADLLLLSKGDLISQSEREVFNYRLKELNPNAVVQEVNGLSGRGSKKLADYILKGKNIDSLDGATLKYTMPSATCSYCVGERRIAECYHHGIVNTMTF